MNTTALSGRPMKAMDGKPACPVDPLTHETARAAAQLLDLSRARRLVYVGGDGGVLAAFLDAWQELCGVWVGPAHAQDAAHRFLGEQGLDRRVRYVCDDALVAIPAGDLAVASAVGPAVESTLRLLLSAGPRWLPATGRWLILQRESPHLPGVVGPPMLQGQGLRVVSDWPLSRDLRMLVCAPAHRILETLEGRTDQPPMRHAQR